MILSKMAQMAQKSPKNRHKSVCLQYLDIWRRQLGRESFFENRVQLMSNRPGVEFGQNLFRPFPEGPTILEDRDMNQRIPGCDVVTRGKVSGILSKKKSPHLQILQLNSVGEWSLTGLTSWPYRI